MKEANKRDFKILQEKWRKKLKSSGFEDHEDLHGRLTKSEERRTISWQNQVRIRDFFLLLDHFMNYYSAMPKDERKVMELYSQGIFVTKISKQLKFTRIRIHSIIKRYKGLILAIQEMCDEEQISLSLNPKRTGESKAINGKDPDSNKAA